MKLFWALAIFVITLGTQADAAIIYVDKDNSCTGDDGTDAEPWCSIQAAALVAVAGDTVRVRDSASAYNETISTFNNGTSALLPIIFEPDVGHTPTLSRVSAGSNNGMFNITDRDWITIRNFNAVGTGLETGKHFVRVNANTRNITGIVVSGNTITSWGGSLTSGQTDQQKRDQTAEAACIFLRSTLPFRHINSQVTNNTITGCRMRSIWINGGTTPTLSGNTITAARCGARTFNGSKEMRGIFIANEGSAPFISGNVISDFTDPTLCDVPALVNDTQTNAIKCDVGIENGVVEKNLIENLPASPQGQGATIAIFIESRCHGWKVQRNLLKNVEWLGIQIGSSPNSLSANNTVITNNTLLTIGNTGINIEDGAGQTIKNNVFCHSNSQASIRFEDNATADGGHSINYNLYCDGATNVKVGKWAIAGTSMSTGTASNLAAWRIACNCDANSVAAAHGLNSDGTIAAASATLNAGTPITAVAFNGVAPDIGAFETMVASSAVVGGINATTTVISLTNNLNPPSLPASACTGFTMRQTAVNVAISACVRSGTNQIHLTHAAITGGTVVDFSYSQTGNVTDSALIGGSVKQELLAITNQSVTNQVETTGTIAEEVVTGGHACDATDQGTAYTLNSGSDVTINGNRLALLAIHGRIASGTIAAPAIAGTLAATWVEVASVHYNTETDNRNKLWVFRTMVGSDQTGTVTITPSGGQTWLNACWSLTQFDDVETSGTNGSGAVVQSATRSTEGVSPGPTSIQVALGGIAHNTNRVFLAAATRRANAEDLVPEASLTELTDDEVASEVHRMAVAYTVTTPDITPTYSWSTSDDDAGAVAIEIRASGTITPTWIVTQSHFRFYNLRKDINGDIEAVAALDTNKTVVPGARFIIVSQLDVTGAAAPVFATSLQYSINGGAFTAVTDSFTDDNVKVYGISDTSTSVPADNTPIAACLSGSLVDLEGTIQRTANAVPNLTFDEDECMAIGVAIELDRDVPDTTTYDFRFTNQDGTTFTYSQIGRAIVGKHQSGM
jgi:parallel beta-helix repeat protein